MYELLDHQYSNDKKNIINLDYTTQKQIFLDYFLGNPESNSNFKLSKVVFYFKPSGISKILNGRKSIKKNEYSSVNRFFLYFSDKLQRERYKTTKLELDYREIKEFYNDNHQTFFYLLKNMEQLDVFSSFSKSRKDFFRMYFYHENVHDFIEFSDFAEGHQLLNSLTAATSKFSALQSLFLLDEPDAFIHPKYIEKLTEIIEKTTSQFIITTHSPTLISRLRKSKVFNLAEEMKYSENLYGRRIEYLYKDLMGFDSHPKEINQMIMGINNLLDEQNFDGTRKMLIKLKEIVGDLDTDYITLKTRLNIMEILFND